MRTYLSSVFQDNLEREMVCEALISDVLADIEDMADEEFTSEDVNIAVSRVLLQRLGVQDTDL